MLDLSHLSSANVTKPTTDIRRQMRFDLPPLFVAQPKQILAHDPMLLPKTNQDRIVSAKKLMSFDPSHLERKFVT
jgi:hypothetical protein